MHWTNTDNPIDFPKVTRIDKLFGQALDKAVPETWTTLSYDQIQKVKNAFADLILLECRLAVADVRIENDFSKEVDEALVNVLLLIEDIQNA
jgi:hypothetical protein